VWNTGLDQRRQYGQPRAWITYYQQAKELAEAKLDPDFAWISEAPAHCLQQTLMDLDKACRAHGTWNVKFRSKTRWSPSFRFPEGDRMRVRRLSKRWGQVNLPKFGRVRVPLDARPWRPHPVGDPDPRRCARELVPVDRRRRRHPGSHP